MPIWRESLRGPFKDIWALLQRLPLSTRLSEDLGIDSLGFVAILMELADELKLDLMAVEISPKKIDTLRDLVSLVTSLVVASNP